MAALAFVVVVAPENPVPAGLIAFSFASVIAYFAWSTLDDEGELSSTSIVSSSPPSAPQPNSSHAEVIQQSKARVAEVVAYNRSVQTVSNRHNKQNPVKGLVYKAAVQLHYESFTTADRWHSLSRDLARSIGFINREITVVNREIYRSEHRLVDSSEMLPQLKGALLDLQETKRELITHQQIAKTSVDQLNENTATLRNAIAISYGEEGRLWFQRLEARKKSKRSH